MTKRPQRPAPAPRMVTHAQAGKARAEHFTDGDDLHAFLIGNLRVLVTQDGQHWFAQGVEIDYAAAGDSVEDVKSRFSRGLRDTARAHISKFQTIDGLLKFAPEEKWKALLDSSQKYRFSVLNVEEIPAADRTDLPFGRISYLAPEQRCA